MNPRATRVGLHCRVRANELVSAREFDEEWVVLDLQGGKYYGLDQLGGRVWKGLVAGFSPKDIADNLGQEYAVDQQTLLRDIVALADELVERGLLVVLDGGFDVGA